MPPALDNIQSLTYFLPEVALTAGVLLVILWDLISRGTSRIIGTVVITLAALGTAAFLSAVYLAISVPPQTLFNGLLAFDDFSNLFRVFFAIVTAVILIFAVPSRETGAGTVARRGAAEFFSLLLIISLGLNLMVMSRNLLMIYISLELVSVISFVMAGFKINDRRSSEGALKYVIFGGIASGVMLYGMSWLFGFAQSLDLAQISERVALETAQGGRIPLVVLVGVACMLAGFGYKIAAAPFHMWTPDVYEGAPTSITAFLSVGPKAAGFAILVRFFAEGLGATAFVESDMELTEPIVAPLGVCLHNADGVFAWLGCFFTWAGSFFQSFFRDGMQVTPWAVIGGVIAIATMVVGNLTALNQRNVKRMLAYSSIAHAGYMLLGFCVFNETGVKAIVFYIIAYALMNLGAFLVVAAVAERNDEDENIEAFYGLGQRAPILAVAMAIFLFSLTGLPPFAGFIGKFYIFAALIKQGGSWNWILAGTGVLMSVVSLFYYARVLRAMFLTKAVEASPFDTRKGWSTATIALAVPTVLLGVYWAPVYDLVSSTIGGP